MNAKQEFQLIMREGVHPDRVVGRKPPPPPVPQESFENGLHIQRNVEVRLRDGVRIFVDIYLPEGARGHRSRRSRLEEYDPH